MDKKLWRIYKTTVRAHEITLGPHLIHASRKVHFPPWNGLYRLLDCCSIPPFNTTFTEPEMSQQCPSIELAARESAMAISSGRRITKRGLKTWTTEATVMISSFPHPRLGEPIKAWRSYERQVKVIWRTGVTKGGGESWEQPSSLDASLGPFGTSFGSTTEWMRTKKVRPGPCPEDVGTPVSWVPISADESNVRTS